MRWRIRFVDVRGSGKWQEGILHSHPPSCWMMMRGQEEDILDGRYLEEDERILEGMLLIIDVFEVVVSQFVQLSTSRWIISSLSTCRLNLMR